MGTTQRELRLQSLVDERATVSQLHEHLIGEVQKTDDKTPSESQAEQIASYREREISLDEEIAKLTEDVERENRALAQSKAVRRVMAGGADGVDLDGEGIAYRSMAIFARDVILTRDTPMSRKIAAQIGNPDEVAKARERLALAEQAAKRTPANTLSSDVGGLQPPQHIETIMQVIDSTRPIVQNSVRVDLVRGQLTYPKITQRPVVAVQASEKTEAGNQAMHIPMETATASVYLGGGDLSWQAVNWSTPNALDMWFRLAAADYALKTEQDAGNVITDVAFGNVISSPLGGTPTFADFLTAVGKGAAAVYAGSGRMADTVYCSPDRYWYLFGLTSAAFAQFASVTPDGIGPMRVIPSRGMDSGEIVVGDRSALLVAETPGAPVDLQVTEPAIGGYEVGIIGAFEAVVIDDDAFSLITTAS